LGQWNVIKEDDMTFTSYSSKSTATRGFERSFPGVDPAPHIEQIDGKWGFDPDRVEEPIIVQEEVPHVLHLIPEEPAIEASAEEVEKALAPRHKSQVEGAVKAAWDFFSAHPDLRRKDAVAGVVAIGVAFYTARTQYQKWFAARRAGDGVSAAQR
jgi:cation transport regulator ChaB